MSPQESARQIDAIIGQSDSITRRLLLVRWQDAGHKSDDLEPGLRTLIATDQLRVQMLGPEIQYLRTT